MDRWYFKHRFTDNIFAFNQNCCMKLDNNMNILKTYPIEFAHTSNSANAFPAVQMQNQFFGIPLNSQKLYFFAKRQIKLLCQAPRVYFYGYCKFGEDKLIAFDWFDKNFWVFSQNTLEFERVEVNRAFKQAQLINYKGQVFIVENGGKLYKLHQNLKLEPIENIGKLNLVCGVYDNLIYFQGGYLLDLKSFRLYYCGNKPDIFQGYYDDQQQQIFRNGKITEIEDLIRETNELQLSNAIFTPKMDTEEPNVQFSLQSKNSGRNSPETLPLLSKPVTTPTVKFKPDLIEGRSQIDVSKSQTPIRIMKSPTVQHQSSVKMSESDEEKCEELMRSSQELLSSPDPYFGDQLPTPKARVQSPNGFRRDYFSAAYLANQSRHIVQSVVQEDQLRLSQLDANVKQNQLEANATQQQRSLVNQSDQMKQIVQNYQSDFANLNGKLDKIVGLLGGICSRLDKVEEVQKQLVKSSTILASQISESLDSRAMV